ncbi:MAG TPA: hypothetical protein VFJ58_13625 [Armatimonadota bacterium]|nr:hypothetical protein [Armatimonadota bacterium]
MRSRTRFLLSIIMICAAALYAAGAAQAAISVTVTGTPTTGPAGQTVPVVFNAAVSGTPDANGECTAENMTFTWADGNGVVVLFSIPGTAVTGDTYPVSDSCTVNYTSSCDGSPGSASGSGSTTVTVDNTCPT